MLSPYQSHKPFDGVWAKSIPSHWDDAFLSALFYEHKLKNIGLRSKNLLSLSYGKIVKKDITDGKGLTPDSYETYNIIAADDIVLRLTDLQNDHKSLRTAISKEEGIVTSAYTTLRRRVEKYNPDYLYFYIHDIWGNCNWTDEDKIKKQIEELPDIVKQDEAYQNAMRDSDAQNARDESDRATLEAILGTMASGMELYSAFQEDKRNNNNQSFKKWLLDMVFNATYKPSGDSARSKA